MERDVCWNRLRSQRSYTICITISNSVSFAPCLFYDVFSIHASSFVCVCVCLYFMHTTVHTTLPKGLQGWRGGPAAGEPSLVPPPGEQPPGHPGSKLEHIFYLSSKWVVKQRRQHTASTVHLAQKLLMSTVVQSAEEWGGEGASRRRSAAADRPTESDHQSWASYSRRCQSTQGQTFYGHSAFEANWKGEKAQRVSRELTTNPKKLLFWSVIFSYCMQQQWKRCHEG